MMQELLERFGLDEDDLAAAIDQATAGLPPATAAGMDSRQAETLSHAGLRFGEDAASAGHRARRGLLAEQLALLAGPDTAGVARTLGVSESRVRHQAAARHLLAVRVGRSLRFPAFQFDDAGTPLRGLPDVLTAVPETWPPAQVGAFLGTPQPELTLDTDGPPVAPATWLAAGGDPSDVTRLLGTDWA